MKPIDILREMNEAPGEEEFQEEFEELSFQDSVQGLYDVFRLVKDADSYTRHRRYKMAECSMGEAYDLVRKVVYTAEYKKNQEVLRIAQELNAFMNDAEIVYDSMQDGPSPLPIDMDARVYELATQLQGIGSEYFV